MVKKDNPLLPQGCELFTFMTHNDDRGDLTEIYRQDWIHNDKRVQWNLVHSKARTLRGVHTHVDRIDYLVLLQGKMMLGLRDLRRNSPSFGMSALVMLGGGVSEAAYIPTGVAHGFYFPEPSTTLYGMSEYFNSSMDDELGCHPGDPDLDIPWPDGCWLLSERDQSAGTLKEMQEAYDLIVGSSSKEEE